MKGKSFWPRCYAGELPRERLISICPETLKDQELLAIVLGTGYRGRHVGELAKSVLADHLTESLIGMELGQLSRIKGLSKAKGGSWW